MENHSPTFDKNAITELVNLLTPVDDRNYASVSSRLMKARSKLQEIIVDQVTDPLNQHLKAMPQDSLQEKQKLTIWANNELRSLGIAVQCPKTSTPAMLRADQGRWPAMGRFQLRLISGTSETKCPVSSNTLFTMRFMPNHNQPQSLARFWSEKHKQRQNENAGPDLS